VVEEETDAGLLALLNGPLVGGMKVDDILSEQGGVDYTYLGVQPFIFSVFSFLF
jgi:hypothetical protein